MTTNASKSAPRQDFEALAVILSVAAVLAIVSLIASLPEMGGGRPVSTVQGYHIPAGEAATPAPGGAAVIPHAAPPVGVLGKAPPAATSPAQPMSERQRRVTERFNQAVAMLHAKRYDYAIIALDAVLEMAPELPEAYVNMGYAFIGLGEYGPASKAFEKAIELRPEQRNAYFGLAEALEGLGEYEIALGAMRSYIHLSPPDDPYLARARAAIWEWEAKLGRVAGVREAPPGVAGDSVKTPDWKEGHPGGP